MSDYQRALITGGAGFVGQHLRPAIIEAFPCTDFVFTTRSAAAERPWTVIDLTESEKVCVLIEDFRPDLVIHLAAQASVGMGGVAGATWRSNVGGAIALAEALARHTPNVTVLNVSSAEVYGLSFLDGPVNEESPLRPVSVYGRTKVAAEEVFSDVLPPTAKLICARPFNHAGPGQDERFVVPALAAQVARIECGDEEPPILTGNLDVERDFLDVRDVVRAYVELIRQAESLAMRSAFNICSGHSFKISDLLFKLQAMTSFPISAEKDPSRTRGAEIPRTVGDASAIRRAIGWVPRIELDQTLREVLDSMRNLSSCSRYGLGKAPTDPGQHGLHAN